MYSLNKAIWILVNPTLIGFVCVAVGAILLKKNRFGRWLLTGACLFLWIWATPLLSKMQGVLLEREWLENGKVPVVETFPIADAIVLLGGSMGHATNLNAYAEMYSGADRVWQAARLFRAGKSKLILVSGRGNKETTSGLLMDFAVPTNAMIFVDSARNTEEESREILRLLAQQGKGRPKILLVTSAWHMKRAKLMFAKFAPGLDVIPAPADFEATTAATGPFSFKEFLPNGIAMGSNECFFHEWLGYWGYKLFR